MFHIRVMSTNAVLNNMFQFNTNVCVCVCIWVCAYNVFLIVGQSEKCLKTIGP